MSTRETVSEAAATLLDYCRRNNWSGYDPFDGLNSRVFKAIPFLNFKAARLVFIQAMKRSPINFRPLLLIPKGENPKACALFTSALIRLYDCGILRDDRLIFERLARLLELRSKGYDKYCWGYNFDWQNKAFLLPKYEPNIICTTFAGNALLDAYEKYHDQHFLSAASSAGEFLIEGLNITRFLEGLCFSYTPFDKGQVHNTNLLGAAYLGRLAGHTGNSLFREYAEKAALYSLSKQSRDGSWPYGEHRTQSWIDSFHTGYNLVALKRLSSWMQDKRLTDALAKGFAFYLENFFAPSGLPKYYHNNLWPIDIHSVAQAIVTLCELSEHNSGAVSLAEKLCLWAISSMRSRKGYFYYQKTRFYENHIPYMRWSQAWMLYAMAFLLNHKPPR